MRAELESALAGIRIAAFDVDGVFTDGRFSLRSDGTDSLRFHTRDGLAVKLLMAEGIAVALITGRRSEAVRIRAEALGIPHVHRGVEDKVATLREIAAGEDVPLDRVLFMGDDLPDLPALAVAGVGVAPADAAAEVRARVDLVTEHGGGNGAVREIAERLLAARGRWEAVVARIAEGSA